MTSNIGRALTQTDFTSTSSAGIGYFGAMSYNEKFRKTLWPFGKGLLSDPQNLCGERLI